MKDYEAFPLGNNFFSDWIFEKDNGRECGGMVHWQKIENGYSAVLTTTGITEPKIELTNSGLKVTGENEIYGKNYKINYDLPIDSDIMNTIIDIKYSCTAGLTNIVLSVAQPEEKKINIRKV